MLLPILAASAATWVTPCAFSTSIEPAPLEDANPAEVAPEVEWLSGQLSEALSRARLENKLVFAYFWTNSSQQCQRTWTDAISSVSGQTVLEEFVCFSAPLGGKDSAALVQEFNITTLPTMLILTPYREVEDALLGYHSEGLFTGDLNRILNGVDTVSSRRKLAEAAPDDLDLRFSLAAKLDHVGAKEESKSLYDSIIRDDPRGESIVSARLQLWNVMRKISENADDPSDPVTFELEPIYKHMAKVKPDAVVVEGWDWISEVEGMRGEKTKVMKAMRKAWPHMSSDNQTLAWGLRTASYLWENRDGLSASDKSFALEVAERCAELDEEQQQEDYDGDVEERDLQTLDVLANCYLMSGRASDALRTIELSIEKNGRTPEREQTLELCRAGNP